jgi:type IV pilus assembly protein PilM
VFPLGIDIGSTRLRVTAVSDRRGKTRVHNVVVRDLPPGASSSGHVASPGVVAEILRDAVDEARVHERHCVAALANDAATMRTVTFPPMSGFERAKAARFEAARFVDYPPEECTVRLVPRERRGDYILGIARSAAIASRLKVLRAAGLSAVAIDHETCAWRRAVRDVDCVVDVGLARSTVIVFADPLADVRTFPAGGDAVTEHIARSLCIDKGTAEQRKRNGGEALLAEPGGIVAEIADAILEMRSAGHGIRRIGLAGNGARIEGLPGALERATGVTTVMAEFPESLVSDYPSDVMRAGAPDWLFAYGIALWSAS